jgi:hypothetical protein
MQNAPALLFAYTQAPWTQDPGSIWQSGGDVHGPPQGRQLPAGSHWPPSQIVPASSLAKEQFIPLQVPGAWKQGPGDTPHPLGHPLALDALLVFWPPAPPAPPGTGAPMPRIASQPQTTPPLATTPTNHAATARRLISSSLPCGQVIRGYPIRPR